MVQVMHLYLDDSGTRNPDRKPKPADHGRDWFSLGGVLLRQEDEAVVRRGHTDFMARYDLDPDAIFLHSAEIRGKTESFSWLAGLPEPELVDFLERLYQWMAESPVVGIACVIDRPGYDARYLERYGRQRWNLCKTAFSVVVERAAKHARAAGCKLKVFVERSDKIVDGWMRGYYDHMRSAGMPFDAANMGKYRPLSQAELQDTLYEFRLKSKSSPVMQLADLYLWPMSIGGYHKSNRTYARLIADKKLIDCLVPADEVATRGLKYSCWENVKVTP